MRQGIECTDMERVERRRRSAVDNDAAYGVIGNPPGGIRIERAEIVKRVAALHIERHPRPLIRTGEFRGIRQKPFQPFLRRINRSPQGIPVSGISINRQQIETLAEVVQHDPAQNKRRISVKIIGAVDAENRNIGIRVHPLECPVNGTGHCNIVCQCRRASAGHLFITEIGVELLLDHPEPDPPLCQRCKPLRKFFHMSDIRIRQNGKFLFQAFFCRLVMRNLRADTCHNLKIRVQNRGKKTIESPVDITQIAAPCRLIPVDSDSKSAGAEQFVSFQEFRRNQVLVNGEKRIAAARGNDYDKSRLCLPYFPAVGIDLRIHSEIPLCRRRRKFKFNPFPAADSKASAQCPADRRFSLIILHGELNIRRKRAIRRICQHKHTPDIFSRLKKAMNSKRIKSLDFELFAILFLKTFPRIQHEQCQQKNNTCRKFSHS